jgi:hypothetical protein
MNDDSKEKLKQMIELARQAVEETIATGHEAGCGHDHDHEHHDHDRIHPAQLMRTPQGEEVEIDCGIAKLIDMLWQLDIETISSCQEDAYGCVMIAVADPGTAVMFWMIATATLDDRRAARYQLAIERIQQELRQLGDWERGDDPTSILHFDDGWRWRFGSADHVWCAFPCKRLATVESNVEEMLAAVARREITET